MKLLQSGAPCSRSRSAMHRRQDMRAYAVPSSRTGGDGSDRESRRREGRECRGRRRRNWKKRKTEVRGTGAALAALAECVVFCRRERQHDDDYLSLSFLRSIAGR